MKYLNGNLKLAVQKNGRLSEKSIQLLSRCGFDIDNYKDRLIVSARNYQLDVLFLRDDDIPEYVQDGVADIGMVGEDVTVEKNADVNILRKLGFGHCKLMIAIPENDSLENIEQLNGKRIATSYPHILRSYLDDNSLKATIVDISGSVEIAPSLGVADYICDIVSTGTTLKLNRLKKSFTVFESQSVLIENYNLKKDDKKRLLLEDFLMRIDSAQTAKKSKYLMMNVPKNNLEAILEIIPSLKSPTVLPLAEEDMVAVHAVIPEDTFWNIVEDLKKEKASGILLLPIENMIV
jgi:ATP phosphoribosyltransferase